MKSRNDDPRTADLCLCKYLNAAFSDRPSGVRVNRRSEGMSDFVFRTQQRGWAKFFVARDALREIVPNPGDAPRRSFICEVSA